MDSIQFDITIIRQCISLGSLMHIPIMNAFFKQNRHLNILNLVKLQVFGYRSTRLD